MSQFALIGLPVWILVDGTWSELSNLADHAPEGYKISAYLIFGISLGNTVPLIGGMLLKNASQKKLKRVILATMLVAFTSGILMSLFWTSTIVLSGRPYSIPMLSLFTILGACASLSNVTHFTFVSLYAADNTTALAVGMALGSMTAGFLAIIQGIFLKDVLTVSLYYLLLTLFFLPAFYVLYVQDTSLLIDSGDDDHSSKLKSLNPETHSYDEERSGEYKLLSNAYENSTDNCNRKISRPNIQWSEDELTSSVDSRLESQLNALGDSDLVYKRTDDEMYTDYEFITGHYEFLIIQFINACLSYGIVPSLISSACGNFVHSTKVLLFATALYCIVDPIGKLATSVERYRIKSVAGFKKATAALLLLSGGLVVVASLPASFTPLYGGGIGDAVPVLLYLCIGGLFGFCNTCVFRYFKDNMDNQNVKNSYRWISIATQLGAFVGSLTTFIVVVFSGLY